MQKALNTTLEIIDAIQALVVPSLQGVNDKEMSKHQQLSFEERSSDVAHRQLTYPVLLKALPDLAR